MMSFGCMCDYYVSPNKNLKTAIKIKHSALRVLDLSAAGLSTRILNKIWTAHLLLLSHCQSLLKPLLYEAAAHLADLCLTVPPQHPNFKRTCCGQTDPSDVKR
jgi:hypothetical protein